MALSVLALHNCSRALIQCRCCAFKPGFGLACLMFVTFTAFLVMVEKANAVLTIWPPPSPKEPSISIIDYGIGRCYKKVGV